MTETEKDNEAVRLADAETIARLSTAWLEDEITVAE
jgi:hypothetical protein